jgi:hypothetical protein
MPRHSFSSRILSSPESSGAKYLRIVDVELRSYVRRVGIGANNGRHCDQLGRAGEDWTYDLGMSFSICFGRMTCLYSKLSSESD